jgi:hypothetical protein
MGDHARDELERLLGEVLEVNPISKKAGINARRMAASDRS